MVVNRSLLLRETVQMKLKRAWESRKRRSYGGGFRAFVFNGVLELAL